MVELRFVDYSLSLETPRELVIELGDRGPAGLPGVGVPVGGLTGQVLAKASAADYDTVWVAQSGGGGGGGAVSSVNGQTGVVVLSSDEIDEGVTNLYFTGARAVAAIKADVDWNASDWDLAFGWGDHAGAGYLVAGDVANFETTTQLNARDTANRSRANHTGVQAISTVTGLQSALDGKAAVSHTHTEADITDLQAYLLAADIANFETTTQLNTRDTNNRSRVNHTGTQAISTVSGLQSALDGKANTSHTHTASQVTDFDAEVANNTDVASNTTHRGLTNNPHGVTASQVGLGNVTNHAQVRAADKASTAQAEAGTDDNTWMTPLKTKQAIDEFGGGGVTDHGALTGLADDDHTQYILVNGSRAFTAKVSYSSHPTFTADTELVDKKYVDDSITAGGGYTDAQAQDAFGALLTGTQTLITVSYDSPTKEVDFVVEDDLSLYDNSTSGFISGISAEPLSDLSDVTITTIAANELLQWNGSAWINRTLAEAGVAAASHTHSASQITDFDAEVANNSAVTANTAKVTNATHTGDVTGATALTIANDAVTNAKLANVASATIKGRVTASTGDPEDLTATQVRTLLNVEDGAQVNTVESLTDLGLTATATELNYVDGVTSAIQTQLDGKAATSHTHTEADITDLQSYLLAADIANFETTTQLNTRDTNNRARANHTGTQAISTVTNLQTTLDNKVESLADLSITATAAEINLLDGVTATTVELNYVDGVTSNIQTQLNGKAAASHTHTASEVTDFDTAVAANSAVAANTAKVTNATHTGDVTGATALTIANNAVTTAKINNSAVTNSKLANMTASTIKGRISTTGAPQDLTAAQVRTVLNVADGATANTGTVTSVAVSGSDGIEVDSGSPVTGSGTIALGVNAAALRSHINVEDGADVTDEANVVSALNGATLSDVGTPASADRILLQDASDSNNVKYASFSEFGGGGTSYPWQGAWETATAYAVNDCVENNGSGYVCITGHTSGSSTEPGVGASWEANWDLLVEGGATTLADLGVTATASEVNVLDGITATTAELNHTDGVTSNIQTQLNAKAGITTTETLTNKTLAAPVITGAATYVKASSAFNNMGNFGTSQTVNWNNGNKQRGTLNANVTITFSNVTDGQALILRLAYSGAQRTITWPSIRWFGGSPPDAPASAGETLEVVIVSDGTTLVGSGGICS